MQQLIIFYEWTFKWEFYGEIMEIVLCINAL